MQNKRVIPAGNAGIQAQGCDSAWDIAIPWPLDPGNPCRGDESLRFNMTDY